MHTMTFTYGKSVLYIRIKFPFHFKRLTNININIVCIYSLIKLNCNFTKEKTTNVFLFVLFSDFASSSLEEATVSAGIIAGIICVTFILLLAILAFVLWR